MSRVASRFLVVTMATLLATGWLSATPRPTLAAGTVSLAAMNVAYSQDFNTLNTTGTTNTALPDGWWLAESGTSSLNNGAYGAGTGSGNAGDTYSFGTATAPLDRAFGGLRSGSLNPTIGASFTNNTGSTVAKLDIAYTGEMYRAGVANRNAADRIDFQLSADASSLTTGVWTDYDSLDFASPDISEAVVGAKDGNAAGFRTALSFQVTGLSIPAGSTFWIRWTDFDISSSDDGLAVDDFSLTPRAGDPPPDDAPEVDSTNPSDGAENVAVDANIGVTFSEDVSVAGDWFDIDCESSGPHTATASGGPSVFTLDPDDDFAQLENCTVTIAAAGVTDQDANDPPDTMAADFEFDFQVGPECDDTYTPIYDIQGDGPSAAITGTVDTEGVVVGDFEGATNVGLNGFYIQDPDGDGDTDTSDGIFVFTGSTNNGVTAGDLVRVKGYARDRFPSATTGPGMTSLTGPDGEEDPVSSAHILDCGDDSVAPTPISLPWAFAGEQERFEGMLVTFPQDLVIAEYFNYDRFGELVIALPLDGETRPFTPTAIEEPGSAAWAARTLANSLRRITLDDGLGSSNPSFTRHPNGAGFSLANRFRGGDKVADATGVMSFDFGLYRIQPTSAADYTPVNPRPATPEDVGGGIKVAAMNTLNFFLTLDTTNSDSGPGPCGGNANLDCRGADSSQPLEFTRQRDKLLQALAGIDADVLGLNELENTPGVDPVANLVRGLNVLTAPGTYNRINTGVIGTDAIKVGLIYKAGVVTPVGDFQILDSTVDERFLDTKSRPALAQTFYVNETGARFTVVVNHLKSKGSDCNDVGDPIDPDGQGNCNGTRTLAAEALVDWLATDPTGSGDPDFAILGDLNSYAMEDPIKAIEAGADGIAGNDDDYTNLIAMEQGAYAYSYTFDGMAGYLDHALGNASFTDQVTGATEWHINSDEPDILDYDTSFKSPEQDAFYEANQYRTSDHDPVIVGLDLVNAAPTFTNVVAFSCAAGAGGVFNVTIDDYDLLETELTLALTGNTNTTLVPNANATVSGSGANRTITITAANLESGTAVLTFTLSDGWNDVPLVVTVKVGTNGTDVLTGTSGNDILMGMVGEDTLAGLGGADILCGAKGDDTLDGGDGNDLLEGGIGEDVLVGGLGDDVLRGQGGEDVLTGGAGADSFSGGSGADVDTDFDAGDGDTSDGT